MSNLSELLPTGGGQNAVDFVATGTLASGQAVALKTDGTVETISFSGPASAGSPVVFESAAILYTSATFDSNSNKVVIAYRDVGNSSYGTAVVGTVSGASISFGTPVVFESAQSNYTSTTFDSTNNKIVIAYQDGGNADYGTAIVGTVSGTSISFGSAAVFESAAILFASAIFDSTNNKIVIAYRDGGNSNYGTAIVGTVSGTSISFGTAVVFETGDSVDISATFDSNSNKAVISYQDASNSLYGTAIVGTVSGTSISFGTAVVYNSGGTYYTTATFDSNSNKAVIAYRDGGNSNQGTAIVGTVSGTSISFGAEVVFETGGVTSLSATFDSNAHKVVIAYQDSDNSQYGTVIVGTVSGTSISFNSSIVFEAAETQYTATAFDSNAGKVVIAYKDVGNSGYGTSVVFTSAASNSTDFIGITAEAISSAATGAVNVYGGINSVQTGLTIASDYYVQADGTLSTTSTSPAIKVGQAISATTINMKDLT